MRKFLLALLCLTLALAMAVPAMAADIPTDFVSTGALTYDLEAPVNNGEPITIDFWVQTDLEEFYTKWAEAYSEIHPNVSFEFLPASSTDHFTKLALALQSGEGPDMFHMHNARTAELIDNMKPYDFNVMPLETLEEDFVQIDEHLINDGIYYIDFGIMTSGIYYNKAMWEEAGLTEADEPKTWDELVEVAKKLTKFDDKGNMLVSGFNINGQMEYLIQALNYNDGMPMFREYSKDPIMTNDTYIANVTWLRDLYNVEKVGDVKFPAADESFLNSTTAMIYAWGWFGNYLTMNFSDLKYGFFALPSKTGEVPPAYDRNNGESSPGISGNISDEKYAVVNDFLRYMFANDNCCLDFALSLYVAPSKKTIFENERILNDEVLATSAAILDRTIWPGAMPNAYHETITKYISEDVLINGVDPAEAVANCYAVLKDNLSAIDYTSLEAAYGNAAEFSFDW